MDKHVMKLSAELAEAKEKLARDSSSSDESDVETTTRKKKIEIGDKPTEEVCLYINSIQNKRNFFFVERLFFVSL
jgi:hypothetical protein